MRREFFGKNFKKTLKTKKVTFLTNFSQIRTEELPLAAFRKPVLERLGLSKLKVTQIYTSLLFYVCSMSVASVAFLFERMAKMFKGKTTTLETPST